MSFSSPRTGEFTADLRGVHYDFLKHRIPAWFAQGTQKRQEELANHPVQIPAWYRAASPELKAAMQDSHGRYRDALNRIETQLSSLKDIAAFAEPLLKAAIKAQFKLDIDVRNVYFARKYAFKDRDDLFGSLVLDRSTDSSLNHEYRGVTLLEAALANFEPDEEKPPRCQDCQIITGWNIHNDAIIADFAAVNSDAKPIAPHAFAKLCRSLDLGAKYQAHLKALLEPAGAAQLASLHAQLEEYARQQLAISCEVARQQFAAPRTGVQARNGVSEDAYQMLQQLINDKAPALDCKAVVCNTLMIFDIELVGPLTIGPDRWRSDRLERVVVYLPGDPEQPLKEYASSLDFMIDLRARLHRANYRQFFSRFVPVSEQSRFFRKLQLLYAPSGSGPQDDYPLQADPADLRLRDFGFPGPLWAQMRQSQMQKVFADARTVAVPTGDEDRKAREERLAAFRDAVLSVLNLAAFVVPGLGPLMLGVGAVQMCAEVYEGIEAYADGEAQEMWAHFSSVALNIGMLGAGAAVLPHVQLSSRVDGLKPVTMANGKQKLWNPNLEPYNVPLELAANAKADALGLYEHAGKKILPLEGDHYHVAQDPHTAQYRIQHPSRADAYAPELEHNGQGAWTHELEEPLTWDTATLLKRLGQPADGLDTTQRQRALHVSGVETDALRGARLDQAPVPVLLADSLRRFRIHQQLGTLAEQLHSADPLVYAQAEPGLQMDLMQRRGLLPSEPRLRVMDSIGNVLWDDPVAPSSRRRSVVLNEQQLARGELLEEVLSMLQVNDAALVDIPGNPGDPLDVRASLLREYLATEVERLKSPLTEERYRLQTHSDDVDVQRLVARYPGLSTDVARQVLNAVEPADLPAFRRSGALPEHLAAQAAWYAQEARVSRAYEGLFLDGMANVDSYRLALHTLASLSEWPDVGRIELREFSSTGKLLDAIGSPNDVRVRTLTLNENGQFDGVDSGDFYSATWQLLSPGERTTLGMNEPAQLRTAVQHSPLPRAALRGVLLEHPFSKPAYDPDMRLLGGGRGVRQLVADTANALRTSEARVRRLFPTFSDADVAAFIQSHGTHVRGELSRLEADYSTLKNTLNVWTRTQGTQQAERLAGEIKRSWRREAGSRLSLRASPPLELPALDVDFSHIQRLELSNVVWSETLPVFLKGFRQLKHLQLRNARLTELPEAVTQMRQLTHLRLGANRIRLTELSARQLGALSQLQELDLAGSPLGITPDFSGMQHLQALDLSRTDITQWPSGLREQANLHQVDLRHNQLRAIPQENLYPPVEPYEKIVKINGATLISDNPFPAAVEVEVDHYWKRLVEARPELAQAGLDDAFSIESPSMRKVRRMYPDKTMREARELIWSLGDDAEAQLSQREQEFDRLTEQLNAWAFSGGGARQRYVRANQLESNAINRDHRYTAKERILRCWRRETPQKMANDGTPIGLELDLSGLRLPSLPDLEADFSHVGSLKLNGMQLSASPEGFLARFRGVRWLDMSDNQLLELPPALGQMDGLTRLFLQKNQIHLTPETALILAQRHTLRALWLDANPLGIIPDFTLIGDMRSLSLRNTGIDQWPTGLGEQPLLDRIDLSSNRIETLPEWLIAPSEEQLPRTALLTNTVHLNSNPLSEGTLRQIRDYADRLEQVGITRTGRPDMLVVTALQRLPEGTAVLNAGRAFARWTRGFSEAHQASRKTQWLALREQPGGDGFFQMLSDLDVADAEHPDLQRRVWEVIDSITQNTVESMELRQQMFEWAGRAACCDRAALSFSNLEIMTLVHNARLMAGDQAQGAALIKLSRGLFRLDEVEKIALADIEARKVVINNTPGLTETQKASRIQSLEEVEIRLAYRFGLKGPEKLDLPGQPSSVRFTSLGNVTPKMLDDARAAVLKLNDSPQEFQALISRNFWQDYVTSKYRTQFESQRKPYQERLAALHDQYGSGELSQVDYDTQARNLQAQLAIEEAALIETLTRQELAA